MENKTIFYEFILIGLSNNPSIHHQLFLLFLLIYLVTLSGNLLILLLIFNNTHLHTPMYFFLGNLAILDICYSQVTGPRMLSDFYSTSKTMSLPICLTQVFFFICFGSSECFLLAVMSYDRYVAICLPLHYVSIMERKACAQLSVLVWVLGVLYSLTHTLCTCLLTFCGKNIVQSFFCDLTQLFQLSCTDTFFNIMVMFVFGGAITCIALINTFVPYIFIFRTIRTIQIMKTKHKAFSTCTSHLTAVFIFYSTLWFTYLRPNSGYFEADMVASVVYAVISPLLNPIIYSLRNEEIKRAFRRALHRLLVVTECNV